MTSLATKSLPTYQTNLENKKQLEKFIPRPYQMEAYNALFGAGPFKGNQKNKLYLCWARGAGKDMFCFMAMVRKALERVGQYFYLLPSGRQARLVMWDTVLTHNGLTFRDMIPKALVKKTNDTKMLIELINGSLIHILGSNEASEKLVGANPSGIVFSESQVSNLPESFDYVRPRLALNDGWVIFNGTPRGMSNYFYQLLNIAKNDPEDWFYSYKTVYDTQHIDPKRLAKERKDMSPDKFAQEYECDFSVGQVGCFWGKEMDKMRLEERINRVAYEPAYQVWVSVDLGVSDPSCFIFFQVIGNVINIIDYEEHTDHGLDWYAKMCEEKGYKYGGFFFPHDLRVREIGAVGAASREDTARNLGFKVNIVPNISVEEGIEAVRMILPRVWIDEKKCRRLIDALSSYHRKFDEERKTYYERPEHDWASHPCFTADALVLTRNGMRQIIDIKDNDEILTIYGWETCTKAVKTQENAQLVEVKFIGGTTVRCTLEHKFLMEHGWIFAKDLRKDMQILSSLMFSHNISMVDCIDFGQEKDITQKVAQGYIGMFGRKLLEIFQRIAIYTIKIMILLITTFGTLNACLKKIISKSIRTMAMAFRRKQEMQLQTGTDQKLEDCGIVDTASNQSPGLNGSMRIGHVCNAQRYLNALLEKMDTHKNTVTLIAKPCIIESVTFLNKREDVYCIYVPGCNHFSLSNGAIVHNCDAMRMLALSLQHCNAGTTPEEITRMYNQARYGTNSNVPPVFQDRFRY